MGDGGGVTVDDSGVHRLGASARKADSTAGRVERLGLRRASQSMLERHPDLGASLAAALAVVSTLLLLLGAWAPWIDVVESFSNAYGSGRFSQAISGSNLGIYALAIRLHPGPAQTRTGLFYWAAYLIIILLDVLPLFGVSFGLAVWQGQTRRLLRNFRMYLVLATLATVASVYGAVSGAAVYQCQNECVSMQTNAAWGLWLSLLALALAWLSLVLLWRRPRPRLVSRARSRLALGGVAAFTCGWLLWMLAVLLLPWVTAGCSGLSLSLTHFSRGACMGFDGYDVLTDALQNTWLRGFLDSPMGFDMDALHIIEFAAATGVIVAMLLWRRRTARSLRVPVALWMVLATCVVVVCWQGTTLHMTHGGTVVYTTAALEIGPAVAVSVVALLLGWTGGVLIWLRKR